MTIDTNQFWNLLSEAQLVPVSQVQTLFTEYSADNSLGKSSESLRDWLVRKNAISGYQASIIAAGHSGPFRFGNYTIVERIENGGLLNGSFAARHTKTGYLSLLQFFPGSEPAHLRQWQQIEALVEQLVDIKHPNVAETFEFVTLPNHRFVVSESPSGAPVAEMVPRKARLAWQKACSIVAQTAQGLEQLHLSGVTHKAISPRTIWLEKNGRVQVRLSPFADPDFESPPAHDKLAETRLDYASPESLDSTENLTPASDIYSLGCTLHRIIGGRVPFQGPEPKQKKRQHRRESPSSLAKYELPKELESLLAKMMAKDPTLRPPAAEVANVLSLLSGKADEIKAARYSPSPARLAYLNSIRQFLPGKPSPIVAAVPEFETDRSESEFSQQTHAERAAKIEAAAKAARNRKKSQWKIPVAIGGALVALSLLIGISAYYANQTVVVKPVAPEQSDPPSVNVSPSAPGTDPSPPSLASLPPELRPTVLQSIIEDDNSSLWETPTNGPPIQFSYLPSSPKLLFVFRLAELAGNPEGQRLIQSLGPDFQEHLTFFRNQSGLDLENIEELVVSLHTNDEFEYEPYFIVRTIQPISTDRMIQNWNRPALRKLENQQEVYESQDGSTAYYILDVGTNAGQPPSNESKPDSNQPTTATDTTNPDATISAEATNQEITRFAFGNQQLVEQVALSAGANILSGSLRKMADWTDRERHVNILFLRNALFNDEGQKMMGKKLRTLNRELGITIPDEVRGGLLSLHVDSGNYFELMLDKNIDLKATDLRDQLVGEFRSRRDMLTNFVASIPSSPYWDRVRIRYGGMLADFYQNLRWNVEHGEVVANCWLPPMAAHNLIASSELVLTFSSGTSDSDAPVVKSGPKTLEELLAIKRNLNIPNPPDLNVLMSDLKTMIEDDLGKMPFAFNIRLLGSDLEAKGITKNQRPSELVLNQQSLSEILTHIMTTANPDKDITGPSDPNCELIWVIAEDPQSAGEKAILITTRTAAAEKGYELPEAFRTE